jgi:hypothetical protein
MKVESSTTSVAVAQAVARPQRGPEKSDPEATSPAPTPAPSPANNRPRNAISSTSSSSEGDLTSSGKGVIRNLLAGHYQGVADVRLRINFNEELQVLEYEAQTQAIADQAPAFSGAMEELFPSTSGLESLDSNAQSAIADAEMAFLAATDAVFTDASSAGTLLVGLRSAFETLTAALEPAFDLTGYIADLKSGFEAALAELSANLAEATLRPPLSEPHGNGAAYDKFLAIYRSLGSNSDTASSAASPVDQTA